MTNIFFLGELQLLHPSSHSKRRSINVRYFWMKEHIDSQLIELVYTPSEIIKADGLTKPLPKDKFKEWRNMILNLRS